MIGYFNGILNIGSTIAIGIAIGVAIVFPLMITGSISCLISRIKS